MWLSESRSLNDTGAYLPHVGGGANTAERGYAENHRQRDKGEVTVIKAWLSYSSVYLQVELSL